MRKAEEGVPRFTSAILKEVSDSECGIVFGIEIWSCAAACKYRGAEVAVWKSVET